MRLEPVNDQLFDRISKEAVEQESKIDNHILPFL